MGYGMSRYDGKSGLIIELDYYSRTEQWDKILERCKGGAENYPAICYVNMALAQKGVLGDRMFAYDQIGADGLLLPWNRSTFASVLLNDIYFTMNHIALSQKMAFEAFVCSGSPRMLQRLIQTNLIYGAYPVAEKYLDILEHTYGYRGWATAQRRFLYNDAAVETDSFLGSKRQSLSRSDHLSKTNGLDMDLLHIAEANPADHTAIEYAGGIYLLEKELESFRSMIETYYGTEALPTLPTCFQEALLVLSIKEPDYYKRFGIEEGTVQRFSKCTQLVSSHRNDPALLRKLMKRSFQDTYWYYYLLHPTE
jgi:hypothetical protein